MPETYLDGATNYSVVREYAERRALFEQLCSEVVFILQKRCLDHHIETAHIISRVKTLPSILEKIERKEYQHPLDELTDIAAVRVVFLYQSDLARLTKVVEDNFRVIERVEKNSDSDDRFGYVATHFVLRLRKEFSGARYEDVRNYNCELQVRTVLQDAWAVVDHHLRYKTEAQIPHELRRRVHALAALLQNADEQFDEIEVQRRRYIRRLKNPRALLNEPVNRDSILAYIKYKFKLLPAVSHPGHVEDFLIRLDTRKYPKIRDIDRAITATADARTGYSHAPNVTSGMSHVTLAVACVDRSFSQRFKVKSVSAKTIIAAYRKRSKEQDESKDKTP